MFRVGDQHKKKLVGHSTVCNYVDSQATLLAGHGHLGIISMFVLPPGQKNTKRDKHNKNTPNRVSLCLKAVKSYHFGRPTSNMTSQPIGIAWACMYSHPFLPSSSLLLRVYEPFCQNMDVTSNNYLYKQKH